MARQWDDTQLITVRQLLALDALVAAHVLGGTAGLDRQVTDIVVSGLDRNTPITRGSLLIVDGTMLHSDTYQVDLLLRAAQEAQGSGLLLTTPSRSFGLAAGRLSNKLGIPLLAVSNADPLILGDHLRQVVMAPQVVTTRLLLSAMDSFRRIPESSGVRGVLDKLAGSLEMPTALAGADGTSVEGVPLTPPLAAGDRLPVPMTTVRAGITQVAHPIQLGAGDRPSFWLVARKADASEVWAKVATEVLQIAAWAIGSRLLSQRLQRERDARFRLGVLNQIVAATDDPDPALLQQIGVLGWRLDGWCTGIHVQASGDTDQQRLLSLTEHLTRNLAAVGISAPIIERPDGWTLWLEDVKEPPPSSFATVVRELQTATESFVGGHPGISLHVGIGSPHHGFKGLRKTLGEAREASVIAQAGGGDAVVQHIDELGITRVLFGWYASDTFRLFAKTLLEPVLVADPGGELVSTLECFLDNQSSPTLTATAMNLHRNTILNRMERVRALLSADLDRPDARLAVHLACRVMRLNASLPPAS